MARRSAPKRKRNYKKKVSPTVKQYVKRTLAARIEDKYTDSTYASYAPTWTYNSWVTAITMPTVGTSDNERIGDKIRPTKLQICGQMYGINVSHVIKMIFFRWHPNTTPTGNDIMDSNYTGTARAIWAPYNHNQRQSYTILKTKQFVVSLTGTQNVPFKFNISRKKLANIQFANGGATGTNLIYCLMIQDGFSTLAVVDMVARLWYEDA
nr:MAG TPA: capsid protein [Circoviridae sp.]